MERESRGARRERWRGIYEEYEKSGLTFKAYSGERGLSLNSLRGWARRFRGEERNGEGSGKFVEVSYGNPSVPYSVLLKNGRELRVGTGFSGERVKELVGILESC